MYSVQLDFTLTGTLDPDRLRDAVHAVVARHPHLAAQFSPSSTPNPSSSSSPNPKSPGSSSTSATSLDRGRRSDPALCADERTAVCDLADQPRVPGRPDPHRRGPAPVRADQPPHRARRLVDADPAARDLRQLRRAPAARGGVVPHVHHLAGRAGPRRRARRVARRARRASTRRRLSAPQRSAAGSTWVGRARICVVQVPEQTTQALGELARSCHTTVSTVLQGAWAVLLTSLTGTRDVVFGTARSRLGQLEVADAESMVGLLINTVPVRANLTANTTAADLLEQLQTAHNDTLEHQHLGAQRDSPRRRPRPAVRHAVRLRELPGRGGHVVARASTIWPSPGSPTASSTTTRSPWRPYRAPNWACTSSTTPMSSTAAGHRGAAGAIEQAAGGDDRRSDAEAVVHQPPRRVRAGPAARWSGAGVSAPIGIGARTAGRRGAADPEAMAIVDGARSLLYRELDECRTGWRAASFEAGVGPERAVGVAVDRCCRTGGGLVGGAQGRRHLRAGGRAPIPSNASPPCWTRWRRCAC